MLVLLVACAPGSPVEVALGPDDGGDEPLGACAEATFGGDAWTLPLPTQGPEGRFASVGAVADCVATDASWTLYDLDGDGFDDLVLTRDCEDAEVGDRAWRIYLGSAQGFAEAEDWALPLGYSLLAFDAPSREEAICEWGSSLPAYATFDVDGDARPDLVSMRDCVDLSAGDAWWRVYPNTGAGFGPVVEWALPAGFAAYAFAGTSRAEEACGFGENSPAFGVTDIDGDGLPDLVATDECVDGEVGSAWWNVWANEGAGFAGSPARWTVPVGYMPVALELETSRCENGAYAPAHALADLDADGRPDFVVTDDCIDPNVGSAYWNYHRNVGTGFENIRSAWPLPAAYAADAFGTHARAHTDCVYGYPAFSLGELDDDGLPDLVVTSDCSDSTLGDTHWRVHHNDGEGFASTPTQLFLPTGYSAYAFQPPARDVAACAGAGNRPAWTLSDADGDGRRDIVLTGPCDGDGTAWRVHPNACPY